MTTFYQRQMRQIIDEMPTGDHRARAAAWRQLAARCQRAAQRHDEEADRRAAAGEADESLRWAKLERARRFVRAQEFAPRRAAEAVVADAAPAPRAEYQAVSAIIEAWESAAPNADMAAYRRWCKGPGFGLGVTTPAPSEPAGFTDAAGYVHLVELAGDPIEGCPETPEKP